jgi:peptidyl-prolyl cis-trans isomerase C
MQLIEKELRYLALRAANNKYKSSLVDLNPKQLQQVILQARRELKLQQQILATPQAAAIYVNENDVNAAIEEIRQRYTQATEFIADLQLNGLNLELLTQALRLQLRINLVLEQLCAKLPAITDAEVAAFYAQQQHNLPETRTTRQILITINSDYAENTRSQAQQRMQNILSRLTPDNFADNARQHSECPSAVEGGLLGHIPPGKLYPVLDKALFELDSGQISPILETELGLHILLCESIQAPSLEQMQAKIRQYLSQHQCQQQQMQWLRSLNQEGVHNGKTRL